MRRALVNFCLLTLLLTPPASASPFSAIHKTCEYMWLRVRYSSKATEFVAPETFPARRWDLLKNSNAQERWAILDLLGTQSAPRAKTQTLEDNPFVLSALPWFYEIMRTLDTSSMTPLKNSLWGAAQTLLLTPLPLGRNIFGDTEVDFEVTHLQLSEYKKFLEDPRFFSERASDAKAMLLETIASQLIGILRTSHSMDPGLLKLQLEACRLLSDDGVSKLTEFSKRAPQLGPLLKSAQNVLTRVSQSEELTREMRGVAARGLTRF